MNRCDVLTVILAVLPVLGVLTGFWVSHVLESKRQATQRASDHQVRQRQIRRDLLEQLQYALAAVRDGSHTAAMLLAVDRRTGVEEGRAALTEPWWRDWQAASQRVEVLTARLADEDLREAVNAVGITVDMMRALQGEGARTALDQGLRDLDAAYARANAIAGRLVNAVDALGPPDG